MLRFFKNQSAGLNHAERRIVRLVSAIQFLTIIDFQMVMPLGADFARDLGIPASTIGWVTGAYTAAAFVAGIAGARLLNKVNRRLAMTVSLWGLVIATALGGLSINYTTLICARILAGLFSGPAMSLSYALLTDHVPEQRRGRALGMVGSIWSFAGIVGLPVGLKLAEWGNWRTPFFIIAALGVFLIPLLMAAVKRTAAKPNDPLAQIGVLVHRAHKKSIVLAFVLNSLSIGGNYLVVPSVAAYFQLNLGYPRDHLSLLYFVAGVVTFFTVRFSGRMIDRFGAAKLILPLTPCVVAVYYLLFVHYNPALPVMLMFVLTGVFNSARYTIISTETSKVPPPEQRAGFMSLISAAQALGQSLGAFASSLILFDPGIGPLQNMPRATWLAILIAACGPPMVIALARLNRSRPAAFMQPAI